MRSRRARAVEAALALLAAGTAIALAADAAALRVGVVREAVTIALVALGAFGLAGVAAVRAGLPASLRGHELLWVPATGACVLALALGALGFAAVPYEVAIGVVLAGGVLAVRSALRRHGLPSIRPARALLWPAGLAVLLVAVALVPMFRVGFPTVVGNGTDATLAVGTTHFLAAGHHPLAVVPAEPQDQVFPLWRSKTPIYYATAAVSTLSGFEPHEVLSTLSALLLAIGAIGFYLLARERLAASVGTAAVAIVLVGLDRVSLHSAMHPYFNQMWGFMALPYVVLLARPAVEREGRGARPLLALFTAVLALAYPLALPIGVAAVAASWIVARRRAGLPLRPRVRVWRGPRTPLWLVPLLLLAAVPVLGVIEKASSAAAVLAPGRDLRAWGGDLFGFWPWHRFFAVDQPDALVWALPALAVGVVLALRRAAPDVRVALAAVLAFGLLAALYFRSRDVGWYFQFKALAFTAPLALTCAAVGLRHARIAGGVVLALWILAASAGARAELSITFDQTPRSIVDVRVVDERLPPGESVRLDMDADGRQLWVAYFLAGQPLCSQTPLTGTSYPHVARSRKADWVLAARGRGRPGDAQGPPVLEAGDFRLYRQRPDVPGPDRCTQRMVQTVTDPTT